MKRLKLFPKIFLYTLGIMLFIIIVAHGLIYLLAPRMQFEVTAGTIRWKSLQSVLIKKKLWQRQ